MATAPGSKDQCWDDSRIQPLVTAHREETMLRLFRKHDRHGNSFFRYSGVYRIVDRWRSKAYYEKNVHRSSQDSEDDFEGPDEDLDEDLDEFVDQDGKKWDVRKTCFVKLERVVGQEPLEVVDTVLSRTSFNGKHIVSSQVTLEGRGGIDSDFCGNCYLDGHGRNDFYECYG